MPDATGHATRQNWGFWPASMPPEPTAPLGRRSPWLRSGPCTKIILTGRGAVWLARLLWEQEVEGSNPFAPIYPNTRRILDIVYLPTVSSAAR
jgi:hypothetical protein